MLAEIHGKIARTGSNLSELLEDQLTGNVFGTLRYLPAAKVLFPFLEKAYRLDKDGLHFLKLEPLLSQEPTIKLWPSHYPTVEPDVEIGVREASGRTTILLEVKYQSGLSSDDAPQVGEITFNTSNNQLIRQMRALGESRPHERKIAIFLTQDGMYPLDLMYCVLNIPRDGSAHVELFWLSWHDLTRVLETTLDQEQSPFVRHLLEDLLTLCRDRKGFRRFQGLGTLGTRHTPTVRQWRLPCIFFWAHRTAGLRQPPWQFSTVLLPQRRWNVCRTADAHIGSPPVRQGYLASAIPTSIAVRWRFKGGDLP